jgi:hypothetical protein
MKMSRELENLEAVQQELEKAKEIVPALAADIALLPPLSQLVFVTTYVTSFEPSFRSFPLSHPPFWGCFENYQAYAAILGFGSKEAQDSFKSILANWDDVLRPVALKAIGTTSQHLAGAEFLHPSFAEATRQFIMQSDQSSIFSQLCFAVNRLCGDPQTQNAAAKLIHPLIANFESLPEEILDRIKFSFENGDKFIRMTIVEALLANLGRLAPPLQQFFDELDPNQDKEIWYLFMQAAFPNPRLSFAQMQELWRRALAKGAIHAPQWLPALHPMDAPLLHYRQLPTELQQVIAEHLESQNQFRWYCLARPLIQHYIHVPSRLQEWVPVLASEGNEFVVYELIMALKSSYERLPSEVQSLVQDFGTDPNWKCRAYIAVWFGDQLDHLQPDHADLVRQLALQDPDGRVRISVVYAHLVRAATRENGDLEECEAQIFDELFYSDNPINKAGVLFSLFDTFRYWRHSKGKEKFEKRFGDLVTDQEPLVVAMLKYTIPQEDYPLELAQRPPSELLDSEIEQYEDVVSSLANGLRGVALGPGAIKQGYD